MNRQRYTDVIVNKLFPAIKEKWPAGSRAMSIKVQQDNANPHTPVDHPDIVQAGTVDGWNLILMFQSPNSSDVNVLDLGFFNAIQAFQQQECARSVDQLMPTLRTILQSSQRKS